MGSNKEYKTPSIQTKDKSKQSNNIQMGSSYLPFLFDMSLQQTIGNREVQRMFQTHEILARLFVNQPNDLYEQEADRIARHIINMGENEVQLKSSEIKVRKKESSIGGKSISSQTETGITSLNRKGHPLEPKIRDYFQPRFGVDLKNVRIHKESNADRLARAIRARAFSYKNNIVFAKGEYKPETKEGKKLIAHELTHVIQQGGNNNKIAPKPAVFRDPILPDSSETDVATALEEKINSYILSLELLINNSTLPEENINLLEQQVEELRTSLQRFSELNNRGGEKDAALAGLGTTALVIVGDDATVFGTADDILLPFLGLAALAVLLFMAGRASQSDINDAIYDLGRRCDALSQTLSDALSIPRATTLPRTRTRTRRNGPLPIYWPHFNGRGLVIQAPNPANSIVVSKTLVRNRSPERDLSIIPGNTTGKCWHHVTPLFLSGPDTQDNLAENWISYHIAGHTALRIQPHLTTLGVNADLYQHPVGTTYVVSAII